MHLGENSYGFTDEMLPIYPDIVNVITRLSKTNTGKVYTVTKVVKLVASHRSKKIEK